MKLVLAILVMVFGIVAFTGLPSQQQLYYGMQTVLGMNLVFGEVSNCQLHFRVRLHTVESSFRFVLDNTLSALFPHIMVQCAYRKLRL